MASAGESLAVMPTISNGKTSRIPKTATTMPIVRKICCHFSLIRSSTLAFTTALSKDRVISRMPRIRVSPAACTPP